MFPSDDILLARGKYSTLGKERRAQVERIRKTCETLMAHVHGVLRSIDTDEPAGRIEDMRRCLDNLDDAGSRVVQLTQEMLTLRPIAWPE